MENLTWGKEVWTEATIWNRRYFIRNKELIISDERSSSSSGCYILTWKPYGREQDIFQLDSDPNFISVVTSGDKTLAYYYKLKQNNFIALKKRCILQVWNWESKWGVNWRSCSLHFRRQGREHKEICELGFFHFSNDQCEILFWCFHVVVKGLSLFWKGKELWNKL